MENISDKSINIFMAPVQGATDAAWRFFHKKLYGFQGEYTTPFIRLEHGKLRKKDAHDYLSPLTDKEATAAQIIFKNSEELNSLVKILIADDCRRIDINMGCPFPLQTARGRGAATLNKPECVEAVKQVVLENPEIDFSVKMRLGLNCFSEWENIIPVLNELPLKHITVHPRIAKQQYAGEPDLEQFGMLLKESKIPIIYNGDITTIERAAEIQNCFPSIKGIMIGRGLLGRPSLANEILQQHELPHEERLRKMLDFHKQLFNYYNDNLTGGEHQVLSKIQPFWEYAEAEIGRKAWKALRKASNMAKYHTAVAMIQT